MKYKGWCCTGVTSGRDGKFNVYDGSWRILPRLTSLALNQDVVWITLMSTKVEGEVKVCGRRADTRGVSMKRVWAAMCIRKELAKAYQSASKK